MNDVPTESPEISRQLNALLNKHGYGFQYRALAECHGFATGFGDWKLVESELAYDLPGGVVGHIDGLLELEASGRPKELRIFAIVECKRVDPAVARWAFVRTPFGLGAEVMPYAVVEMLEHGVETGPPQQPAATRLVARQFDHGTAVPFGLGVEMPTNAKGDGIGGRKNAINDAVAQVLRGTAGFARSHAPHVGRKGIAIFVPLVLTTAELWTSDVSLATATLETGELDETRVFRWPRVFLNVKASRDLIAPTSTTLLRGRSSPGIDMAQLNWHTRTVWIGSPHQNGIRAVLRDIALMVHKYLG